ncbi:hypothetical protein BDY19DRAFT_1046438 [Irpex rosettiformis]|uniref:Uncharacterized protein n=1 Tax=Irpex rosettiformis TaxID=378272 RepID=A0ACB8UB49_9APHY|nr:hypothetical protein BDY19DRAFT_1046438 [Irpex rosettiformis]
MSYETDHPDEPPPSPSPPPSAILGIETVFTPTPASEQPQSSGDANRTPITYKPSSYALGYKDKDYRAAVVSEMARYYYQMDYSLFMDRFVTASSLDEAFANISQKQLDSAEKFSGLTDDMLGGKCDESKLYAPLCESLNEAIGMAPHADPERPPYVFKDVSIWPESSFEDSKIDIAMYPTSEGASLAYELDEKSKKGREHAARVAWAWMILGVEVKQDPTRTAFMFDNSSNLLHDSDKGREGQAQIAQYATQLMLRQHRTFVFIIYIYRNLARLTRWDRVGCIVTKPFDFKAKPEMLLNFVYRLVQMSPAEQGYDTTAVLATAEEITRLEAFKPINKRARTRAEEILANRTYYPIYKVSCPDARKPQLNSYFIGKHCAASYSSTGRATKGYVAFVEETELTRHGELTRLSFMKDYWRPVHNKGRTELEICKLLEDARVQNVPTVIAGGDVAAQRTVTQEYLARQLLLERQHVRLVFAQLARALDDEYSNSSVMIQVVYDALRAHENAWDVGILHRDISANNIMRVIDQDVEDDNLVPVKGILNDWDLARHKDDLGNDATQVGRSGTWTFMSATSLQYPLKPNDLADDLESFIHVVTYLSFRFHYHNYTKLPFGKPLSLPELMRRNGTNGRLAEHLHNHYYQKWECKGGVYSGGEHKKSSNSSGTPPLIFNSLRVSPTLITLVNELYGLLELHYSAIDFPALAKYSSPAIDDEAASKLPETVQIIPRGMSQPKKRLPALSLRPKPAPEPSAPKILDNHGYILQVFEDADTRINIDKMALNDSTQDQLYCLTQTTNQAPSGPTGSGTKRGSLDTGDDRDSKKHRTGSNAGSALNSDLVQIPEGGKIDAGNASKEGHTHT